MTTLGKIRAAIVGGDLDARGMAAMGAAAVVGLLVLFALWSLQGVS